MRLTFDPKYNIAYIQLRPKRGKVRTVQVSDEMNVDLAADGTIYGIELLNANEQLAPAKALIVENRATKTRRSMKLGLNCLAPRPSPLTPRPLPLPKGKKGACHSDNVEDAEQAKLVQVNTLKAHGVAVNETGL